MEKILEDYAAFGRAIVEDRVYLDLDYDEICSALGADREALDKMLLEEIGFSGQGLVDFCLSNFC